MMSLRLYAIAIEEARAIFGAPPDTAAALRSIARERFESPVGADPRGRRFGRPSVSPAPPDHPTTEDADTLLAGRFVRPERLVASWRLIETWVAAMAWGCRRDELDEGQLDAIDFDLAKAGVAPSLGLRALVSRRWEAPVGLAPGMAAGVVGGDHVDAMLAAWRPVIDELDEANRDAVRDRCEWLDQFAGWREAAATAHRPPPDLAAIFGG